MLPRLLKLPENQSLFLFGARGTGKSTLVEEQFDHQRCLYINLLNPEQETRYSRNPNDLYAEVKTLPEYKTHIIIDEVQKIPKLLDIVHDIIEGTNKVFILTGSSARKLKGGGANLLAGRAFVYHLFPFSFLELGDKFNLESALRWGTLPKCVFYEREDEKKRFLQAYTYTYLKEEIWSEHHIKKLDPFRKFLEVSAQCNGKIINYANIARDVGVSDKTVNEYFSILEDTLIGYILEPFHHSFRKRLSLKSKFYYFDTGVVRALTNQLSVPLISGTSAYGDAFEHFIINECKKLADYYNLEYRFSFLKTKDDAEIDLVVERPGLSILFIEIKSSKHITEVDISSFIKLTHDFSKIEPCEAVCFSNDPNSKQFETVTAYHWQEGILKYFVSHKEEIDA
jgi:uncharacterized protein